MLIPSSLPTMFVLNQSRPWWSFTAFRCWGFCFEITAVMCCSRNPALRSSAWCLTLGLTTFGQKFYELLNDKHPVNREKKKEKEKCFAECIFQVPGQVKSVCSSLTFQIGGIVCGCPWGRHVNSTICTCVQGKLEKLLSQPASACVCTLSMHQPFCESAFDGQNDSGSPLCSLFQMPC